MALPIGVTPVLAGKEALDFIIRIQEEAKIKVGLIPTPKLGEALELIKRYSEHGWPPV